MNARHSFEQVVASSPALTRLIRDFNRTVAEDAVARAKADPQKHRLTTYMEAGLRYRYFATKNGRGTEVRFCYSVGRNVAGFFLVWRETVTRKQIRRDRFQAVATKQSAIHEARALREAAIGTGAT